MPRHVLHIGYHKTASTWFQAAFYPAVANAVHVDRRLVAEALLGPSALHFDPAAARERLLAEAGPHTRLVLCHEELSGNPHSGGLHGCLAKEAAERLHAVLPDSDVVILVRHQLQMIAAVYKQYVRIGGTHRPERYLHPGRRRAGAFARAYKMPLFSFDHFDYAALVGHYEALFGRERVHVFAYEEFREDPRGFLRRFGETLDLAVGRESPSTAPANVSYGARVLRLARLLNRLTAYNVADKRCIVDLLPSHRPIKRVLSALNRTPLAGRAPDARTLLGDAVAADVEARYAAGNRRLAERYRLPLARYGYPGLGATVGEAPRDRGRGEAVA